MTSGIPHILTRATLLLVGTCGACLAAELRIPEVPKGHPRVYVRAADLPGIRRKIERGELGDSWRSVLQAATGKDRRRRGQQPVCAAFVYLVRGDGDLGRLAVDKALAAIKKSNDARTFDQPFHWCSCVYDWCYDLLSDQEKKEFIREFERLAASHGPGYPANPEGAAVVGHSTEGWLLTGQLPAGVAIYDETHKMYDAAAKLFFGKFVPVRDFYYPGHGHHQGDSYFGRFAYDIAAAWLFRRMGAGDVFTREQQFVPYETLYCMRPDGQQIRRGDTYDMHGRGGRKSYITMMVADYYDDPYLKALLDSGAVGGLGPFHKVLDLLFRSPGLRARPLSELPRTKYFPEPIGQMVARTGWDMGVASRDAVVYMRIGGYFFGNHQRRDFGTFQIYYRGALAIASGDYVGAPGEKSYGSDHWRNYYHQTISQNEILVFDPDEKHDHYRKQLANDGGQRILADHPRDLETLQKGGYRWGEVSARAHGPDATSPAYSYIAGDITRAYSKKVRRLTRSMVAFNLRNARYPAALVVFDRVIASNPAFKKTWLIHSIQEPRIEGSTITIVRDGPAYEKRTRFGEDADRYGGKLVVEGLLPRDAVRRKVGGPGKEFWVESVQRNFIARDRGAAAEPGAWRVEVSPPANSEADLFLHVMTVMDASLPAGPPVRRIDSGRLVGARLVGRTVLFGRSWELLDRADFRLDADGRTAVLVCDLAPGHWSVTKNGRGFAKGLPATPEAKCIYFEAGPGRYSLRLTDRRVPAAPREAFWEGLRRVSARPPERAVAEESARKRRKRAGQLASGSAGARLKAGKEVEEPRRAGPGGEGSRAPLPVRRTVSRPPPVEQKPSDPAAKPYREAEAAFIDGEIDEAKRLFREIVRDHPESKYAEKARRYLEIVE